MSRTQKGFTLIELMIAAMIIGILAAMAIPNYIRMRDRAREASTKSNMHTMQLAAEDYGVRNHAAYASTATLVAALLPGSPPGSRFKNPFDGTTGSNNAWTDQAGWRQRLETGSTRWGITAYGDSANLKYQIAGRGKGSDVPLVLSSGH
jgi:prepilin-type N-terminal cleavage/methylation domain-containing protein